jgi:uncharacterized membrane protein YfcA
MPDPFLLGLGFFVGVLVGLTGVGGGALLTPMLILVAGVRPVIAVGTDLAFAAVTKAVGAWLHWRQGSADLRLTWWLACGSVPGALVGAQLVGLLVALDATWADAVVGRVLGSALLATAGASLLRALRPGRPDRAGRSPTLVGAVAIGFGIGGLVGLTSVGAGSLLMAVFALLYSLPATRAVGTDVVHGAILAAVAAVAHGLAGRIEVPLLAGLLLGSVPGVLVGGWLTGHLPHRLLRVTIAGLLAFSGLRLL